jgi:hypothetical protein
MRGQRIRDQRHGADGALDGVQQGQAGEYAHGQLLFSRGERVPRLDVVGQRHLLRQPEVIDEAVPDLNVLVVLDAVPVDGLDVAQQLDLLGHVFP